MTEQSYWHGETKRSCGEHRTVGYRAWCYDCGSWCYASEPCPGCTDESG